MIIIEMTKFIIQFDDEESKLLGLIADKTGTTKAAALQQAVKNFLNQKGPTK